MLGLFKIVDLNPVVFFRSILLASLRLVSVAVRRNGRYTSFTPMAAFVAGRVSEFASRWNEVLTMDARSFQRYSRTSKHLFLKVPQLRIS